MINLLKVLSTHLLEDAIELAPFNSSEISLWLFIWGLFALAFSYVNQVIAHSMNTGGSPTTVKPVIKKEANEIHNFSCPAYRKMESPYP